MEPPKLMAPDELMVKSTTDVAFNFTSKLKPCVGIVGSKVQFTVQLSHQADSVKWSIDEEEIETSDELFVITSDENIYTFTILACEMEDNKSVIKFSASRDDECISCSTPLTVQQVTPSIEPKVDLLQNCKTGDDVFLTALLHGHPSGTINWYKGFKDLHHIPNRIELETKGNLVHCILHNVIIADSGVYKLQVTSERGKSELKFNVKIKG